MALARALCRYVGILGALLRREEKSRRQSPFDSIVNLLDPVFLIS
jgi:hypothetical protein